MSIKKQTNEYWHKCSKSQNSCYCWHKELDTVILSHCCDTKLSSVNLCNDEWQHEEFLSEDLEQLAPVFGLTIALVKILLDRMHEDKGKDVD